MAGSIASVKYTVAGAPGADSAASDGSAGTAAAAGSLVIAVDGPSGSGKSSAARGTASRLGLRYLDTGAMYRAVTWWLLEHNVDLADTEAVASQVLGLTLEVSTDPGAQHVSVDGIDVTVEIRNRRVSNVVSLVASVPRVRAHLIALQQDIIAGAVMACGGIVAEGRDIGTVVAPDAPVKVFLTASEQVRAERRAAQLARRVTAEAPGPTAAGAAVAAAAPAVGTGGAAGAAAAPGAEVTRAEQAQRDRRDAPQTQMAADAVEIDATSLDLDDVIGRIVGLAHARQTGAR
jgi:CMP/dCMP kinase